MPTVTVTATNSGGSAIQSFDITTSLRAQATGGADLDLSFVEDSAIASTDLAANWTENGNTVTYAITGTALPAGLSVSSVGVMTGTPTTVTADATYTLRGTDEYGRTTDDTFTLEITAAAAGPVAVSYGELTLAGDGGLAAPSGATAVANDQGTNLIVSGGFVVPDTGGTVTTGAGVTFTGSSEVWDVTAVADTYSARADKTEIDAAHAHAVANRATLDTTCLVREGVLEEDLAFINPMPSGSFTLKGSGFSTNASIYPKNFTWGTQLQGLDVEGENLFFEDLDFFCARGGTRQGFSAIQDTNRLDGFGFLRCRVHSTHLGEWTEAVLVASDGVLDENIVQSTHLLTGTLVGGFSFRHDVVTRTDDYSRNGVIEDCYLHDLRGFGTQDVDNLVVKACQMERFIGGIAGVYNDGPTGVSYINTEFDGIWSSASHDPGNSLTGLHSGMGGGDCVNRPGVKATAIGNIWVHGDQRRQYEISQGRDVTGFTINGTTGYKLNDATSGVLGYTNVVFKHNVMQIPNSVGFVLANATNVEMTYNTLVGGYGDYLPNIVDGGTPALNFESENWTYTGIRIGQNVFGPSHALGNVIDDVKDGMDFVDNVAVLPAAATSVGVTEGADYENYFVGDATKGFSFALTPLEALAAFTPKAWTAASTRNLGGVNSYYTPGIAGKNSTDTAPAWSVPDSSGSAAATGHAYTKTAWDGTVGLATPNSEALKVSTVDVSNSKQLTFVFQGTFDAAVDASQVGLFTLNGADVSFVRNSSGTGLAPNQFTISGDADDGTSNSQDRALYYTPREKVDSAFGRVCFVFSVDLDANRVTAAVNGKVREMTSYSTYYLNNLALNLSNGNAHFFEDLFGGTRFQGELEAFIIEDQFIDLHTNMGDIVAQDGFLRDETAIDTAFGRDPLVFVQGTHTAINGGTANALGRAQALELSATTSGTVAAVAAPATIPDTFVDANWSVATGSAANELDITIASLPSDGGAAITDIEYDIDASGTWISLGTTTTGTTTVTMAAPSTSYAIRLRAVNSVGNGLAGNSESASSGAAPSETQLLQSVDENFDAGYNWGLEAGLTISGGKMNALTSGNFVDANLLGGNRISVTAGEQVSSRFFMDSVTAARRMSLSLQPRDAGGATVGGTLLLWDFNSNGSVDGAYAVGLNEPGVTGPVTIPTGAVTADVLLSNVLSGAEYVMDYLQIYQL